MNQLDFFTRFYASLHNRSGIPSWVFTPLRTLIRICAYKWLPTYLEKSSSYIYNKKKNDIIVSFTSFPARISIVWQVVKSLKNQSVLPEKIILWLSKAQFPTRESIPDNLWAEVDELFEIRLVEEDIRSHKKYFYVMQELPEKTVVTCDDDVYYHPDMLKHLLDTSHQFPSCVISNTVRKIDFDLNGEISIYSNWKSITKSFAHEDLVQIGIGGVLYPPHVLHELTLRKDLFMSLTPMADDIWLNAMARLAGTPIVRTDMKWIPLPIKSDSPSLCSENLEQNRNDNQIEALRKYLKDNKLPDIYTKSYKMTRGGGIKPIVSMTSFPARINSVWQVVECMLRQTIKPAKILLWLSKEQFPTRESIPQTLWNRESDMFEIRMVDGDIRSHKKYYYVSKEYPDSLIFLIDDDIYYPSDILERSLFLRYKNTGAVIANYGRHIRYNEDGSLKTYNSWPTESRYSEADDLFFGSGGGTLFCPSELFSDLTNLKMAMSLAPTADDIWLNAMTRLANCRIIKTNSSLILPIRNKESIVLATQNLDQGKNDKQLNAVITMYGNMFR